MEHWQFLIQKQGDRSWQALESPNTEIFEGRYRVLARSHLPNTDMEVRVSHFSPEEVPPKRRIQKRSRRTNSEGLMAVIPFTYLKSGTWELRCSGDLMSDILGQSWQYSVNLQVISQPKDEAESTTSDDSSSSTTTESYLLSTGFSPDPEDAAINEPVNPVWVKGETAEQILQNLIDLALPDSEPLLAEETVEDEPIQNPSLPLRLTLDRETYVTRWGHLLTIHGQVELAEDHQWANIENLYTLELRIELRSPQRSEILTQIRQSLADKSLPLTIRSVIDIPAECESKLILADISLYGAVTHAGEVTLLANQSFTITADVADLLAVTNAPPVNQLDEQIATAPHEPTPSIDLGLFNLVKTPSTGQTPPILPSTSTPIPEQIDSALLKKTADIRIPQLPKLPETPIDTSVSADLVAEPTLDIPSLEAEEITVPLTPAPINLEQLLIKQKRSRVLGSTFPFLKRLQTLPSISEVEESTVSDELNLPVVEPSPQFDLQTTQQENNSEGLLDTLLPENDSELVFPPATEIIETSTTELEPPSATETTEPEPAPITDSTDDFVAQTSVTPVSPYSSPLIRKWMQSQGYSLPEVFPETEDIPQEQITPEEPPTLSWEAPEEPSLPTLNWETPDWEDNLSLEPEVETTAEAVTPEENQETTELENISSEPSGLEPEPPEEPTPTASTWLTQEIVVDDGYSEPEPQTINKFVPEEQETIISPAGGIVKPLPIPQLYVPEGELIAGKLVRVRVEIPQVAPQVAIKLWVEDCQTRWLLDGPHLLTDLLPNSGGNLEVMTQLNIPFGCLEIRLEAIALNTVTQQESHKVTVVKTVIPPDLPDVTLNDLLGM